MDLVGCFDMRFVRHADDATFFRALHWILSEIEDAWGSMGSCKLIGSVKPYFRS